MAIVAIQLTQDSVVWVSIVPIQIEEGILTEDCTLLTGKLFLKNWPNIKHFQFKML